MEDFEEQDRRMEQERGIEQERRMVLDLTAEINQEQPQPPDPPPPQNSPPKKSLTSQEIHQQTIDRPNTS